jgi:uncharacterized protein (TIGR03790 family)
MSEMFSMAGTPELMFRAEGRPRLNLDSRDRSCNYRPVAARGSTCSSAGRLALVLTSIALLSIVSQRAMAGGGPENVLLVVNANSDSSKTIANCYIELRHIPASNVVYVDWEGSVEACSVKKFVDRIIIPTFEAIRDRRMGLQIDYIVYSSDFPWQIDLRPMFPEEKFPPGFGPIASLTGATYLSSYLRANSPAVVMPTSNWYVAGPRNQNQVRCQQLGAVPSRGFRSRYVWKEDGSHTNDVTAGQRYLLSTMLGVTSGRGNTVDEVLQYLRRSAAADGTRPHGTIYFMKNGDVRSSTRHDCFDAVVSQINRLGILALVARGAIPNGAKDVMGIMAGTATFDLAAAGDTILPGAICEHLTSAGGSLFETSSQTSLTEFLKHGAAGASGTVVEPHAIQAKFPLPSLQLHYARGCSLAESFYQSVAGPYQLLIVGDPLCQPWAIIPTVSVDGVEPEQQVQGVVSITPSAESKRPHWVGTFELFVDGRLVARCLPGRTLSLNTANLPDGYHELRVVAADAGAIETQGRLIIPFYVKNHDAELQWTVSPQPGVASQGVVRISAHQPGATAIVIRQNHRELARVEGEEGNVEIPAALLGRGPVALQAASEGDVPAVSAPIWLQVR